MLAKKKGKLEEFNPLSHLGGFFTSSYVPEGFLQMIYIDTSGFDRQHYQFDYVRRNSWEKSVVWSLMSRRCRNRARDASRAASGPKIRTTPSCASTGVYTPLAGINGFNLHFDSWRLNVQPGLWLPSFVFSQESRLEGLSRKPNSL